MSDDTANPRRKRRFPEVDFSEWNFDLAELLEPILHPMAVRVAEVVWDDIRENVLGYIHMEKQGPSMAWNFADDHDMLIIPLTEMTLHRPAGDYDLSGDDRADLRDSIEGTMIGIKLFTEWADGLTNDLGKLLEIQAEKYPADVRF